MSSFAQASNLNGLIPPHWLDETGFLDSSPYDSQDLIPSALPLFPLYQGGGFGKKVYIGGVIEERYLKDKSRSERRKILRKINEMESPEGVGFQAVEYDGKIYAIRDDYRVIYQNSTSIGLSLTFGMGKTVILGEEKSYGAQIDFGVPFRLKEKKGFNALGSFQEIIDTWSIGLSQDETQIIIDQSIALAPFLIHYLKRPAMELLDDEGQKLPLLPSQKNHVTTEPQPSLSLARSENFSKELRSIQKMIRKDLQAEVAWKDKVKFQVANEKVVNRRSVNEFIQGLCDRLAYMYDVPDEIYPRCKVSASLIPNAWAYPGGDIFISAGLLGVLSNVDSLSLVLGHEIGHVMARHSSKKQSKEMLKTYASTILSTAVNIGVTGFTLGGGWGTLGNVTFLTWGPQMLATSVGSSYLAEKGEEIVSFAAVAGMMKYSREHELQSDRIGQEVAFASGGDLEAMNAGWNDFINFLNKISSSEESLSQRLMRSHPAGDQRLKIFQDRSEKLKKTLSSVNANNIFNEITRKDYVRIHQSFRPYVESYVKALNSSPTSLHKEHVESFLSDNDCLIHALGI